MNFRVLFAGLLFLTIFLRAHAGTEVGNGGVGVQKENQIQVFDLFENGGQVRTDLQFDSVKAKDFAQKLEKSLNPAFFPTALIGQKLANLAVHFPTTAEIFSGAIRLYLWSFTQGQLVELQHDFKTPIDIKSIKLVQIANRNLNQILINKTAWSQMNDQQKMALVFHEVFYSLLQSTITEVNAEAQVNLHGRELNSYFLSTDLALDAEQARSVFRYDLPALTLGDQNVKGLMNKENYDVYYSPRFEVSADEQPVLQLDFSGESSNVASLCAKSSGRSLRISLHAENILLSQQNSDKIAAVSVGFYPDTSLLSFGITAQDSQDCESQISATVSFMTRQWSEGNLNEN
jgi:hypothetical protein